MSVGIPVFRQREMIEALEQTKAPDTFLLDTFFSEEQFHQTDIIDIDIRKDTRRMARFVGSQDMEATQVKKQKFDTQQIKLPYIANKQSTTANDILQNRGLGEALYSRTSLAERSAQELGRDLSELRNIGVRREEWMAAQVLQTGKVPIIGQGVDREIDFLLPPSHIVTLSGGDLWDDAASDPIKTLRILRRIAAQDSGMTPNVAVFGNDAIDEFLANDKVQAYLDKRNFRVGRIEADDKDVVTDYGIIEGMRIWAYDDYYVEQLEDGTVLAEREMIDKDRIILGSTRALTKRHYGAIKVKDQGFAVDVRFLPTFWSTEDPVVDWVRIQSAPCPALHQSDAFVTAKVV